MTGSAIETFPGGCPHDCQDTCAMVYEVQDGKLLGVRGASEHPMTRGGLCTKVNDYESGTIIPIGSFIFEKNGPKGHGTIRAN